MERGVVLLEVDMFAVVEMEEEKVSGRPRKGALEAVAAAEVGDCVRCRMLLKSGLAC